MPSSNSLTPVHSSAGPGQRLRVRSGHEIRQHTDLALALLRREIKGQYRRSSLGLLWILLQPMFYLAIFIGVRQVLGVSSEGAPYVLLALTGIIPWIFFSNCVNRVTPSISSNAAILKKSDIPREIFPIIGILGTMVELLFTGMILALVMGWYQVSVGWPLLWLPVLILLTAAIALALGLGLAAIGTFHNDLLFAIPYVMQMWMLASPVFYPLSQVPEKWHWLYGINPMVGVIEGFRDVLIRNEHPDLTLLAMSAGFGLVVMAISLPLYRRMSNYFADIL